MLVNLQTVKYFLAVPVSGNPSAVSCCLHRTPVAITHNSQSAIIDYTDNNELSYRRTNLHCTRSSMHYRRDTTPSPRV